MRIPKRITTCWLEEQGACREQIKLFSQVFPNGTDLTVSALAQAGRRKLNVIWLALILSPKHNVNSSQCWCDKQTTLENLRERLRKREAVLGSKKAEVSGEEA